MLFMKKPGGEASSNRAQRRPRPNHHARRPAFNAPQATPSLDVADENCCVSFSGDGTFVLIGSDLDTPSVLHIYQAADNGDGTFGQPTEFAPTLVDSDGTGR